MKRFCLYAFSMVILLISHNVFAGFGNFLPSTGNGIADKAVNMGANKALESNINNKIKKKNCAFKNKTTESETTCDVNSIINELQNWKTGLDAALSKRVTVYVDASAANRTLASKRADRIEDQLRGKISWWDYYKSSGTGSGEALKIWVKVN